MDWLDWLFFQLHQLGRTYLYLSIAWFIVSLAWAIILTVRAHKRDSLAGRR